MKGLELFKVHFNYRGERHVKGLIAANPDETRKIIRTEYPGAVIHKVKVDRDAEQIFATVETGELNDGSI